MTKLNNKKIKIRTIIQIFFFILIALIIINHNLEETGKGIPLLSNASIHSLCPFGGVVSTYKYITTGTFVKKIHESSFILMFIIVFLSVLFGPVICGWVCPLGSIQEWVGKIGRKIFGRKYNEFLPGRLDKLLRYIRYIILAWIIYVTSISGYLIFGDYDPYDALFNFWTGEVAIGGLIILIVTLLSSLFIERPWCKYACPLGAFLGISNLFRVFKIRRDDKKCTACKICDNVCPMNIEVSKVDKVRDHQCISCLECTSEEACPIKDTVELSTFKVNKKEASINEN